MPLDALVARGHRAFNDRDFEVYQEIFDADVELLGDGMSFRGVDSVAAYGVGSTTQFPASTSTPRVAFSPDGRSLASANDAVRLRDLGSRRVWS
jgi:hypothetical protein